MSRFSCSLLPPLLAVTLLVVQPADAQQRMPRKDVIDVPAMRDGLCVSNVFRTNMVLQREKPISIWGWADIGEQVTVTFGGNEASATAADDRSWKVTLPAPSGMC